jgi:phosphatidylinositol 4-kinase B
MHCRLENWSSLSLNCGSPGPLFVALIPSHLLVTNSSPSTALELLLLEASAKSQHIALRMQFIFQSYLSQFASLSGGDKFRTCQEMYNRILSAQRGLVERKFREYVGPASILVGGIMGAMGVPSVMGISAEVANRQAQRERVFEEDSDLREPLQRSKSMNMKLMGPGSPGMKENVIRSTTSASLDVRRPATLRFPTIPLSPQRSSSATHFSNKHSQLMSQSQPNLQPPSPTSHRPSPLRPVSPSAFTDENIVKTLHTHYYSTQMQFLQCLQDISLRLRLVPKAARQSALRLELGGLDKWLPADICLANVCPSNDVHDRVVQIVESECTILNSAERVTSP